MACHDIPSQSGNFEVHALHAGGVGAERLLHQLVFDDWFSTRHIRKRERVQL
jgi:hypothetical protein